MCAAMGEAVCSDDSIIGRGGDGRSAHESKEPPSSHAARHQHARTRARTRAFELAGTGEGSTATNQRTKTSRTIGLRGTRRRQLVKSSSKTAASETGGRKAHASYARPRTHARTHARTRVARASAREACASRAHFSAGGLAVSAGAVSLCFSTGARQNSVDVRCHSVMADIALAGAAVACVLMAYVGVAWKVTARESLEDTRWHASASYCGCMLTARTQWLYSYGPPRRVPKLHMK